MRVVLLKYRSLQCAILVGCLCLAGCAAPVRTSDFGKFDRAVVAMQTSSHDLFGELAADARRGIIDGKEFGVQFTPSELMIEREDTFDYAVEARTLESMLRELRSGLFDLNASLATYAASLYELASDSDADQVQIAELASVLNTNLQDASTSVNDIVAKRGGSAIPLSSQATGVVSTLAAAALQAHIERERRESLRTVMAQGQATVDELAQLGQVAVRIAASDAYANYTQWFQITFNDAYETRQRSLESLLVKQRTGTASSDEIRLVGEIQREARETRAALLDRNDKLAGTLDALAELHTAYAKLPSAHAALRESLDKKLSTLDSAKEFYAQVGRMQKLYRKLSDAK